jgi:ATP-dependent Clp protease ATP-binding subunit ClpX
MFGKSRLACSFCRKSAAEVSKLVAGPRNVYICDECVAIAHRIMRDSDSPHPQPQASPPPFWRRLIDGLRGPLRAQAATR